MTEFRISVDLGHLVPPSAPLNRETFPTLAHAVETITQAAHARWRAFASGVPLPNGKVINNRTGKYLQSLQVRSIGDFASEVFTELPYAAAIETGAPARDMKRMLDSSLKVRLTKDGRRYLIIPFRHNAPNSVLGHAMPAEVWNWWKGDRDSSSVSPLSYVRKSGTGALHWRNETNSMTGRAVRKGSPVMVPAWRYKWGTRLGMGDLEGMGFHKDDRVAKRLAGMVNFRAPGAKGGASHSKFLTFRVMMQGSKGWIAPAREGLYPARTTADEIRPVAEDIFREAVERDIQALLAEG